MDISYFEAWSRWLQGEEVKQYTLWGMQVLWWGRLGKFFAVISGLAILVELIGPKPFRHLRACLYLLFKRMQPIEHLLHGVVWFTSALKVLINSWKHSAAAKGYKYTKSH